MPSGGARSHSGPPPDPNSRTSERRGYTLTALPNEGYAGVVPDIADHLIAPTPRHERVWAGLWTTPQACAWSVEQWRVPVVADLVKYIVRLDDPEAPASFATSVRQLRDDLGLSSQGLRLNGWAIAVDEVAKKAAEKPDDTKPASKSSRNRMQVVKNDGA